MMGTDAELEATYRFLNHPQVQPEQVLAQARDPFPQHATVADAHFAIARLGGFPKHNKRPGWQVLARGFEDLLVTEEGASAVIETACDQ